MELPRRPERPPLASINVTPLVDVMLVLLIIFLVTASMGQQGITVALPRTAAANLTVHDDTVTVSLDERGAVWVNTTRVDRPRLTEALRTLFGNRDKRVVFLKADQSVPYGEFVKVVALIKAAGVDQLSMLAEAPNHSNE